MRLVCDSCGARFRIADDLVRGRSVKVRCRQCGAAVEVSGPATAQRARSQTRPPPLPPGKEEWYLAVGEHDVGPLSLEELRLRVQRGEVGSDGLVWREGLPTWETVARMPEVRVALGAPRPRRRSIPPALPGAVAAGSTENSQPRFAVIPGGQATALAVRPRPTPAPAPVPAPRPVARWPVVMPVIGGLALVVAALVLVLSRDQAPRPAPAAVEPPRRVAPRRWDRRPVLPPPADEDDAPVIVEEPLPIEVRLPRPPARAPASRPATAPDAGVTPDAGKHFSTAMAARILRRNRGSLSACDQLAERRGESLEGVRAVFAVRVEANGPATVVVTGQGASEALLACYRSMASQWHIPRAARPYSTRFVHVHRSPFPAAPSAR